MVALTHSFAATSPGSKVRAEAAGHAAAAAAAGVGGAGGGGGGGNGMVIKMMITNGGE